MFLSDTLTLDAPRRTADGYLAVRAKAARTGVYDYVGKDVDPENAHGLRDKTIVHVLRDADQVFDKRAVHSFIGKPITDDHPTESVTATNWKDHARGTIMGAIRDGDHIAFDLLLTDASAIRAVESGKRELSNGYDSRLEYGSFTAADGTVCEARQTNIIGNHIALVDRGRAGPSCRIADAAPCSSAPQSILDSLTHQEKPVKTMLIDGLTVDVSNADTAVATINTLIASRDATAKKVTDAEALVVTRDGTIVARDAEIVALKAAVADAKLTPQQMRDAGKAYAVVCAKAKAMGVQVTDAMDDGAIMKAVVDKAMPGNTYAADHVAIAFEALTKDAKIVDAADPLRDSIIGMPLAVNDTASDAYAAMVRDMTGQKNEGGK